MRRHREHDDAFERLRRAEADIERQIADAVERGELAGLEGEGRPLPRDPDDGAGDRWAAAHVLRNAHAAPEWVDLRKRIFAERDALARRARAHDDWRAARRAALARLPAESLLEFARETERDEWRFAEALAHEVAGLNARIARHNLIVRTQGLQLMPITVGRVHQLAVESGAR